MWEGEAPAEPPSLRRVRMGSAGASPSREMVGRRRPFHPPTAGWSLSRRLCSVKSGVTTGHAFPVRPHFDSLPEEIDPR